MTFVRREAGSARPSKMDELRFMFSPHCPAGSGMGWDSAICNLHACVHLHVTNTTEFPPALEPADVRRQGSRCMVHSMHATKLNDSNQVQIQGIVSARE